MDERRIREIVREELERAKEEAASPAAILERKIQTLEALIQNAKMPFIHFEYVPRDAETVLQQADCSLQSMRKQLEELRSNQASHL